MPDTDSRLCTQNRISVSQTARARTIPEHITHIATSGPKSGTEIVHQNATRIFDRFSLSRNCSLPLSGKSHETKPFFLPHIYCAATLNSEIRIGLARFGGFITGLSRFQNSCPSARLGTRTSIYMDKLKAERVVAFVCFIQTRTYGLGTW